jgi:hypothetical protein
MFGIFILTSAVSITSVRTPSSNQKDAYKALSKAMYIETGANKQVKELERKFIPKKVREYGGWITGTVKLMTEKKISLEWTF